MAVVEIEEGDSIYAYVESLTPMQKDLLAESFEREGKHVRSRSIGRKDLEVGDLLERLRILGQEVLHLDQVTSESLAPATVERQVDLVVECDQHRCAFGSSVTHLTAHIGFPPFFLM